MATKADVFKKYVKIRNEYFDLTQLPVKDFDDARIYNCNTKEYLEHQIKHYQELINSLLKCRKIRDWKQTEEGIAYYTEIDKMRNRDNTRLCKISSERKAMLSTIVASELGKNWGVALDDGRIAKIGIIDTKGGSYPDETPKLLLGHTFELHYDYFYISADLSNDEKEFKVKLKYSSNGEFDINQDTTKIEFTKGIAKFLSNEIINCLTYRLKDFTDEARTIQIDLQQLDILSENPPIIKSV